MTVRSPAGCPTEECSYSRVSHPGSCVMSAVGVCSLRWVVVLGIVVLLIWVIDRESVKLQTYFARHVFVDVCVKVARSFAAVLVDNRCVCF